MESDLHTLSFSSHIFISGKILQQAATYMLNTIAEAYFYYIEANNICKWSNMVALNHFIAYS